MSLERKMVDVADLTDEERAALVAASCNARPNADQRRQMEAIKQAWRQREAA